VATVSGGSLAAGRFARPLVREGVDEDDGLALDDHLVGVVVDGRREPVSVVAEVLVDLDGRGGPLADIGGAEEPEILREGDRESGESREGGA
jgi:hypothetical protein